MWLPQRVVGEARGEVAHDEAEERVVAAARAERAIEAPRDRARRADARVDGARVVVGARVRLDAAAHPLRARCTGRRSRCGRRWCRSRRRARTSSGVTISGQAPCSAFVARTKRGSLAVSRVAARGRGDRPTRRAAAEPVDEGLRDLLEAARPTPRRRRRRRGPATLPLRSRGLGSLRGDANARSEMRTSASSAPWSVLPRHELERGRMGVH